MGYSIHGNEPSGSNAALALAYYLAAAQGDEIDALLNSNIVLFDPAFNPDGLSRFVLTMPICTKASSWFLTVGIVSTMKDGLLAELTITGLI